MARKVRLTDTVLHNDGTTREIPRSDVWGLPRLSSGYVLNRNGIATARYGSRYKSLGLRFTKANREEACRAAERWVRELQSGVGAIAPAHAQEARVFSLAFDEYSAAMLEPDTSKQGARRLQESERAYARFVLQDTELNNDSARKVTADGIARLTTTYKPGTSITYIQRWRHFMDYCRGAGWITIDPVALSRTPRTPTKLVAHSYSDTELEHMLDWCRRKDPQFGLLIEFLATTGSRITETLALRWQDVYPDRVEFNVRVKQGRRRVFPLGPFPELVGVLAALREQQPRRRQVREDRVFAWRDRWEPARRMREMLVALSADGIEITGGDRPLHAFRTTAERRMRDRGISIEIRGRLKGHSPAVIAKHYDAEVVAGELERAIRRDTAED